jgi:hypothetical protein
MTFLSRGPRRGLTLLFAVVSLGVGTAALMAAKIEVDVQFNPSANFAAIASYTWLPSPPPTAEAAPGTMVDPLAVQRELDPIIVGAVDAELQKRGIQKRATGGDVQVVYYLSHGASINAHTLGSFYAYASDFYVYIPPGGGQTTAVRVIEEGSLVIDVVDDARAIWRGTASARINRENDDAKRHKLVRDAVKKLFDRWPKK